MGVAFEVKGGSAGASYFWNIAGVLPPGVTATPSNGFAASPILVLSGTPLTVGQYTIQLRLDGSNHQVLIPDAKFTITIIGDSVSLPQLVTTVLFWAGGLVGYQYPLSASGGTPPYTWSAAGLPTTLTLDAAGGTVSGTTDLTGTFDVPITTVDSVGRTGVDTLILRVVTPGDFKGTWSGVLTKGALVRNGVMEDLTGQRLSVLFDDEGVITKGALHSTSLERNQSGAFVVHFDFGGLYIGQFNGFLLQLTWHVACSPLGEQAIQLDCVMHANDPTNNAAVVLSRINDDDEDTVTPTVTGSVLLASTRQMTLTFSEPMSSGWAATLNPSGSVDAISFSPDGVSATFLLGGVNPSTSYVLTLNPTGTIGLVDLAGNPLAETPITFMVLE